MPILEKFNTLAKRVAYSRKKNRWSQAELARRIGTKAQTIQSIESGRTKKSRWLVEIATHCSVEAYWLSTGSGEPEPPKLANKVSDRATYGIPLSAEASDLAHAYDKLPRQKQNIVRGLSVALGDAPKGRRR